MNFLIVTGLSGAGKSMAVNALEDIGYLGFLTIEREVGENPAQDIALAIKFLHAQMGE